jgi:hypothetical protein
LIFNIFSSPVQKLIKQFNLFKKKISIFKKNSLFTRKIYINISIRDQHRPINIGLIILVFLSSALTFVLAEFFVYKLQEINDNYDVASLGMVNSIRPSVEAANYVRYVSYSAGNDSNSGNNESSPWRTIPKVNSYLNSLPSGDSATIFFKRGDVWEMTTNNTYLQIKHPNVIIDAYGDLNSQLPTFDGRDTYRGGTAIMKNGTPCILVSDNDSPTGDNFIIRNIRIIDAFVSGILVGVVTNGLIQDCIIEQAGWAGIGLFSVSPHFVQGVTVERCSISRAGYHANDGPEPYSDGSATAHPQAINANLDQSINNIFRYNHVFNCWTEGIGASGQLAEYNLVGPTTASGIYAGERPGKVRYNIIYGTTDMDFRNGTAQGHGRAWCANGIGFNDEKNTSNTESAEFYGNIVVGRGSGMRVMNQTGTAGVGPKIYNNLFLNNAYNFKISRADTWSDSVVKNNLSVCYDTNYCDHVISWHDDSQWDIGPNQWWPAQTNDLQWNHSNDEISDPQISKNSGWLNLISSDSFNFADLLPSSGSTAYNNVKALVLSSLGNYESNYLTSNTNLSGMPFNPSFELGGQDSIWNFGATLESGTTPPPTCTPDCFGKQCGPDGCSGSCGTCTAPATCQADGTCQNPSTPPPTPSTGSCYLYDSTVPVPTDFAAAYNPLSTQRELLLRTDCDTPNQTVNFNVGNGSDLQFIWDKAYFYRDNAWQELSLDPGNSRTTPNWIIGQGSKSIRLRTEEMEQYNHLSAYVCTYQNDRWNCGCQDQPCLTPYWNLQSFQMDVPVASACTDTDGDYYISENIANPAANCASVCGPGHNATCQGYNDCDDGNASINWDATEICNDNIDNNCHDGTDENCSCVAQGGVCCQSGDTCVASVAKNWPASPYPDKQLVDNSENTINNITTPGIFATLWHKVSQFTINTIARLFQTDTGQKLAETISEVRPSAKAQAVTHVVTESMPENIFPNSFSPAAVPGDTIIIDNNRRSNIRFYNFHGTPSAPFTFTNQPNGRALINQGNTNGIQFYASENFMLRGDNNPSVEYGIEIDGSGPIVGGVRMWQGINWEVSYIHIHDASGGISQNNNNDPGNSNLPVVWTPDNSMGNCRVHHNLIEDMGGAEFTEGMYLGKSKDADAPKWETLEIDHNRVLRTGSDGIQAGRIRNTGWLKIHDNYVEDPAYANVDNQDMGIIATLQVNNLEIYNNTVVRAAKNGIYVSSAGGTTNIHDNVIWQAGHLNPQGNGISVPYSASIINNTIVSSANNGILANRSGTNGYIRYNLLIANNRGYTSVYSPANITDNRIQTGISGENFTNATQGDFSLTVNSPARNAGVGTGYSPRDFLGVSRPQGTAVDIGAFEYMSTSASGNNWYFSNSSGTDSGNDCTNQNNPCKTLSKLNAKINSMTNNVDSANIYLKRGDTWTLTSNSDAIDVDKSNITIDAYGTGNKPVIDGNGLYPNTMNSTGVRPVGYAIHIGSDSISNIYIRNIRLYDMFGGGIIYSGSSGARGPGGIQYCEFEKLGSTAINLYELPNTGGAAVLIENNWIYDVSNFFATSDPSLGWPQAINSNNHSYGHECRYNVIRDNYGEGIGCNGFDIVEYNVVADTKNPGIYCEPARNSGSRHSSIVRYNLVWQSSTGPYNSTGIRVYDEKVEGDNSDITYTIYGNTVVGRNVGIGVRNPESNPFGGVYVYNNTLIDNNVNLVVQSPAGFDELEIINNASVVNSSASKHYEVWNSSAYPAATTIGPNFYEGDGISLSNLPADWRDGTNVFGSSLLSKTSGWRSLTAIPSLNDFRPQSGSSMIDNPNTDDTIGATYSNLINSGEFKNLPNNPAFTLANKALMAQTGISVLSFTALILSHPLPVPLIAVAKNAVMTVAPVLAGTCDSASSCQNGVCSPSPYVQATTDCPVCCFNGVCAAPPPDSVHYQFDEGAGTIAHDAIGNYDGTVNGASWISGKIGQALSFDGVNDSVNIGDVQLLTNDLTISTWLRISDYSQLNSYSVSKYNTATNEREYAVYFDGPSNELSLLIGTPDGSNYSKSASVPPLPT